ncbi:uncharacterized protein LOC131330392 isoform X1 [Rhododendron vialii]|uniref:uncharacterized protein LOC131330392 isoform X1 n=1 Tax=Rhododendron vialii TaxID=182163 RepID=UPI00265EF53A|nr:uncharacterized protein LOC131330392 isoform X1 [Rhododendron vialii]XP_058219932.1 uncharacterized protein LOC131330392 isoform X1 [Rhododendron vialii]XP_058219933.1 uncharacterized protein LOC131330392 isoform X1 [Rhododendron vialii]
MAGAHLPFESPQRNLDSQEESGSVFPSLSLSLSGIWVMQIGWSNLAFQQEQFQSPTNEKQQNAPAWIQAHKSGLEPLLPSLLRKFYSDLGDRDRKDLSGRPLLSYDLRIRIKSVGKYDIQVLGFHQKASILLGK